MFGMTNTLIRETIKTLKDPANWNGDGNHQYGKKCIVTACFDAACERSTRNHAVSHGPALNAIRTVIERRYGLSRGGKWDRRYRRERAEIISFNDHKKTTHADVMSVLYQAEKNTRPFWRGRLEDAA